MTNPSPKPASEQDHDRLSRWGLYLLAVVFAAFGIEGLFLTDLLLEPVELTLTSPSAYADVRAVYGGCFLALALLFVQGARKSHIRPTALMVSTLLLGVFVGARALSWVIDGPSNGFSQLMHGLEAVGFVLSGWLWRRSVGSSE